jgi:hypothetical protein
VYVCVCAGGRRVVVLKLGNYIFSVEIT